MLRYTFILLICAYQVSAQSDLNRIFNLPNQITTGITKIIIENDTIVALGSVTDTPGQFGLHLSKYDTFGNTLWYRTYYPSTLNSVYVPERFTGFIPTSDGGYVAVTAVDLGDRVAVIKFSHEGDIIWETEIDSSNLNVIDCNGIAEMPDGYMVVGWQQDANYQTQALVCKLNKTGEVIWKKIYGEANADVAGTVRKRSDNSYFIGATEVKHQSGVGEPGFWQRSWIFEVDSLGTLQWEWKSGQYEYFGGAGLFDFAGDDALVYATSRIPHYISPWLSEFILRKIDINTGTVLWQKAQTSADMTYVVAYADLEASPIDGGWDIIGTYQHYPNGYVRGGLSVHTTAEGDLLWMREDTAWMDLNINVDENYLNCIGHLSSGSIIAGGDVLKSQPTYHNEAWLLKISPGGCLSVDDCATVSTEIPSSSSVPILPPWSVYPNPNAGSAVLLPDQRLIGKVGKAVIFDLSGRPVSTVEFPFQPNKPVRLDLSGQPHGLYTYQVWLDGQAVGAGKILVSR